jgi:hypothetical protein
MDEYMQYAGSIGLLLEAYAELREDHHDDLRDRIEAAVSDYCDSRGVTYRHAGYRLEIITLGEK